MDQSAFMGTGLTHEEYVASVRANVASVALEMLEGKIPFLVGAIKLSELKSEAEVDYRDEDFMAFDVIASETDDLPIGRSREYWSAEALKKHQPDIDKATAWSKEFGIPACQSLIRRFCT